MLLVLVALSPVDSVPITRCACADRPRLHPVESGGGPGACQREDATDTGAAADDQRDARRTHLARDVEAPVVAIVNTDTFLIGVLLCVVF